MPAGCSIEDWDWDGIRASLAFDPSLYLLFSRCSFLSLGADTPALVLLFNGLRLARLQTLEEKTNRPASLVRIETYTTCKIIFTLMR